MRSLPCPLFFLVSPYKGMKWFTVVNPRFFIIKLWIDDLLFSLLERYRMKGWNLICMIAALPCSVCLDPSNKIYPFCPCVFYCHRNIPNTERVMIRDLNFYFSIFSICYCHFQIIIMMFHRYSPFCNYPLPLNDAIFFLLSPLLISQQPPLKSGAAVACNRLQFQAVTKDKGYMKNCIMRGAY